MLFISFAAAALLFYGFVRYLESSSLFFPSKDITTTPRDAGLAFEDVTFVTADGVKLSGWFIPHPTARRNLLYFHGNAGNISSRVDKMAFFHSLGFNIIIFDYRGYGKSQGRPSEEGLYKDGRAAFDYLASRTDVGRLPIVLYGASIGGAVAVDVAVSRKPAALVTEAAFTSAKDIARIYYPFVPSFMISMGLDSARKIAGIDCPKLLMHSRTDEIIPYRIGRKLFESAAGPKEFLELEGGHNDNVFQSAEKVKAGLTGFLDRYGVK